MKKETQQLERRGLPGGPNETFIYTTGVFSTEGFRMDSPDVNNYQNIIPSGSISMKERDGSPLRKGPIHGVDNLGYEQIMYPGYKYEFPGTEVTETLMAKMGGALLDKTIKCGNCGWEWKAADGGSDLYDCHKCKGGKGLIKAQVGTEVSSDEIMLPPVTIEEVVIKKPLTNFGQVRSQIAKKNTWEDYAQRYLGNFEKNMGQTINNLPEYRKQEYEDYINKLAFDEYVKKYPKAKGEDRGAYIDRIQAENADSLNFENAYEANADYNDETDVNKWRKGLMGLGSIVLGPDTVNNLKQKSDYFSAKEKQEMRDNPISTYVNDVVGTLDPLSIPVEGIYGNKSFGDIASGQSADIPMSMRILGDPLMVLGEAAPLLSKGISKGISAGAKALGTEEGLLSNMNKLNSRAFTPNTEAYYRKIGNDVKALESTVNTEANLIDKLEHNVRFDNQDNFIKRFSDVPLTKKYNNLIQNQEINEISKNRINDLAENWVYENPGQRVENQKIMEQINPLLEKQKLDAEGIFNMSRRQKIQSIDDKIKIIQGDKQLIQDNVDAGATKYLENLQNKAKENPNYINELLEEKKQIEETLSKYGDEYFADIYDPNYKNLTDEELNAAHLQIKTERDNIANEIQTIRDQVNSAKLNPEFEQKIKNLYSYAGEEVPTSIPDRFPIESGIRERNRVVYPNAIPESIADLNSFEQTRLLRDQKTAAGVNNGVTSNIYTFGEYVSPFDDVKALYDINYEKVPFKLSDSSTWLGKKTKQVVSNKPSEIIQTINVKDINPEDVFKTIGHEVGHDFQKFGNWGELITKYNDDFNYRTTHGENDLSKLFQKHMVAPDTTNNITTWHSSGNELHSDLVAARFEIMNKLDPNPKKAVEMFRANEGKFNEQIIESGVLDKFFKPNTPIDIKKKLINLLPAAIPLALTAGGINQNDSETLSKQEEGGEFFIAQDGLEKKPIPTLKEFRESFKKDKVVDYRERPRQVVIESTKTVVPKLPKKLTKQQVKIVQKDLYENPIKPEGITSGDKTVDFLYNNEWLMDVPILGGYIKDKAKEISQNSGGNQVVHDIEKKVGKTDYTIDESGYTGNFGINPNNPNGASLIDQYFSEDALLPLSKYKPKDDYLEFLPSYSIKTGFDNAPNQITKLNDILNFNLQDSKYKEFLKNKKPIYLGEGTGLSDLLGVDLGSHKTGIGWDDKMNLPYLSVSDAWDFEPSNYSKKWTRNKAPQNEIDKTFIQSYLMHKAGNPFKIYDRFYFDPETKEYIKDDAIGFYEEGGETITQVDTTTTPSPLIEYVVKKGDTLSKIAAANNTSIASIMRNNENIADPNVINIDQKINLVNKNVYAPKEEVYRDWNTIRNKKDKINKLSDEQKIVSFHNDKPEESYLIVDKKNAVMKLYTGGNLTKSFEVGVGQNAGDAQTVTKVKNGKTDWTAGNKSTGAGIYTISNINPASEEYYNEPAFNLKNENGIEVATTIHGTPKNRRIKFNNGTVIDNRMSNGCINGKCEDLKELYGQLDLNTKVYILPEDKGNNFQIVDGKPVLRVSSQNRVKYNNYVDQTGTKQKGQGVNQSTNTLVYKPIKAYINEKKFKDDVFQWNDPNDEDEYNNTTKPFINALTTNKREVMKAAKISSDVYNELAKMAFGIYGTESNFGDEHFFLGNLFRAGNKFLDPDSSSSPDVISKATTYGADENYRSVGYTQLRWNYLNKDEKAALKKVGITSNKDFLNPKKAAIGTVTVLGIRYNQQLTNKQKQDVWKYLPTKWNNRANYSGRVKNNSSYLSFKQLDKKEDGGEFILKAQKGEELEDTSWTAYLNPANWGTSRYDDKGSFKEAFRAARNEGDSDFLWKGNRYTTEIKSTPTTRTTPTAKTTPTKLVKPKGITPEILIRQAYRESAFNPNVVSPKGYKGLGQIGDSVIKDYKKANKITGSINPFDIKQNSDVQKYSMNELYNSSFINKPGQSEQVRLAKTLAAYNWGRGNVSNLLSDLKEEGVDIYNSLDWINKLPKEPREYINDILLQKNSIFNTDFSKALNNQKNKSIKRLYGFRDGGEPKSGSLMAAYNRLPMEKKMRGAVVNKKQFGGQLIANRQIDKNNIAMYKDYVKGNLGNEIEVIKNYDKLNRIYYSKAKDLGMTTTNYIMTHIVGNS